MERVRREELESFCHEDNIAAIDALLEIAVENSKPSTTSGLVELQRLLSSAGR
jgi:hypothetical protein